MFQPVSICLYSFPVASTFNESLAAMVMYEELVRLHPHLNLEATKEDITLLTADVVEREYFDQNYNNGHIKAWEIICVCKYIKM